MAEMRAAMDLGTDPADPKVQELARRWMGLVREFTGSDPGISQSVQSMWQREESVHGIDTAPVRLMMEYVGRALAASKSE